MALQSEVRHLRETIAALTSTSAEEAKRLTDATKGGIIELRQVCDVRNMSGPVRKGIVDSIFIEYPRIQEVLSEIGECHMDGISARAVDKEPECMFIEGGTNAGKTAVRKFYEAAFTREFTCERTIVPILPIILPYPASPKSVAIELLKKLGDPNAERGSTAILSSRVANYIRDCGVQMIVLDELHHFIDRTTDKVLQDVSEWMKTLIKETLVPVIALGKPTARAVLDYDDQLKRLFNRREILEPFQWNYIEEPAKREFRRFLHGVDLQLPLAERSGLGSEDLALRIHYATDGVVGFVMTLIKRAVRIAIKQKVERLELSHLAAAFKQRIQTSKVKKKNPFLPTVFTPDLAMQWRKEEENVQPGRLAGVSGRRKTRASNVLRT